MTPTALQSGHSRRAGGIRAIMAPKSPAPRPPQRPAPGQAFLPNPDASTGKFSTTNRQTFRKHEEFRGFRPVGIAMVRKLGLKSVALGRSGRPPGAVLPDGRSELTEAGITCVSPGQSPMPNFRQRPPAPPPAPPRSPARTP